MNIIKSFAAKVLRRKFRYVNYKNVQLNELFQHEGRKYQKLDGTRACTTSWPIVIRDFTPATPVIITYY